MKSRSITAAMVLASLGSWAPAAASFESDACRQSLERLHRVEEIRRAERAASTAEGGAGATVEQARRDAADHCLGKAADLQQQRPPPPARVSPPVSVEAIGAPPVLDVPARQPAPAPPPAVPGSRPPTTVTQCDSAGCWTSEGRYLLRVGPDLVGPAALCSIQAGVLHCR